MKVVILLLLQLFTIISSADYIEYPRLYNEKLDEILPIKGVNIFAFQGDTLTQDYTLNELLEIKKLGGNTVVVNFLIYQKVANSTRVYAGKSTPKDDVLAKFTLAAHKAGLKVFLKPLVVCEEDDCTMVNILPSNISEWFASYTTYITSLASLSERVGVDVLSVALELQLFSGHHRDEWVKVIDAVKRQYSGVITYCSIFYPVETQNITFWDHLDFISMDTYLPLWDGVSAFPSQIVMNARYKYYLGRVDAWHQSLPSNVSKLPIVLSEVGYPSSIEGLITPYLSAPDTCNGTWASNLTVQRMAWEAVLTTVASTDVVQGVVVFWFDNPSSSDYCPNKANNNWGCSWDVRGKPAEKTIADAWCGVVDTTCIN